MDAAGQIRDRDRLFDEGSPWRRTMMALTPLVRPLREEIGRSLTDGSRRARNLYDSTMIVSNNNLGSAVYGSASNPADKWFAIGTDDPDFDKWPKAKTALTTYSRRMLASYGPSYSAFYAQTFPLYLDTTGLGQGFFYQAKRFDSEGVADGFIDKCIPLSEAEFRIDDEQRVTHFYRQYSQTAENVAALAKKQDGQLSDKLEKKAKEKPQDMVLLQHSVFPNPDYKVGMLGPKGKKFASCYLAVEEKFEICRKGYTAMPFYAPAWERAAGERHGRGAGEMAWADGQSLQVMQRDNLVAGSWQANPAWGYAHDANMNLSRLKPGALIAGAIDTRNNEMLRRLSQSGAAGSPFSLEMANQLRQAIKDAFEGGIINIIAPNRTGMTPTEVLDVREEKFRRMAPYQGNITAGFLDLHVRRRFELMQEEGVFQDVKPPKELAGKELHPRFTSPAALAQAAARASSALRAAGALAQAAALDPSVMDRFNGDRYAVTVLTGFGVSEVMNDDEETAQKAGVRQRQAQAAMTAELAEKAAGAAKDGADATAALRARPGA